MARFLRQIAAIVEEMDSEQLVQFAKELKLKSRRPPAKPTFHNPKKTPSFKKPDPLLLERIFRDLQGSETRESGSQILDAQQLSKEDLSRLARMAQVHFTKDDNVIRMKEKIIETTIGSRLGSLAIRGEHQLAGGRVSLKDYSPPKTSR